jgi:hypothetical protein
MPGDGWADRSEFSGFFFGLLAFQASGRPSKHGEVYPK